MSFSHWLTVAGLALLPLGAPGQQIQQQLDPADADAFVSMPRYTSAFNNYRPATDPSASPDKVWRAANDGVQSSKRHAGHMQEPVPANSSSTPKADPHGDHGGHQSKGK